jgi:hypothetical protein
MRNADNYELVGRTRDADRLARANRHTMAATRELRCGRSSESARRR